MSTSDEKLNDKKFTEWLAKQFSNACRKEKRWKTHLDQPRGVYEYQHTLRMKRCIREAAAYEEQAQVFSAAVDKVDRILGASLDRNEIPPGVYQAVMDALHGADLRRL